ncbi:MAG: hypothetical protein O7G88_17735 [bacterium]|nr:hypothetical protein [bacterium]
MAIDNLIVDGASCSATATATAATDQRGVARPQGAACDIGVFEAPPSISSVADALADLLNSLGPAAAAAVQDAIDALVGGNGGQANNGVPDKLANGDLNAALVKLKVALAELEAAEAAAAMPPDLTDEKNALAEAARGVAQAVVDQAAAVASSKGDLKQL